MKLLIVGSDKVYAIENFYVKYLREVGVEVYHFPAQTYFYDYYQKNILNKLLFKAGLSSILKDVNDRFKAAVEEFEPAVIWIFKGMEIFPSSLQWAKEKGIKLLNFNGDSPFLFSGKGSGNQYVTDSITLFDLHLTYNRAVKVQMEATYKIPTEILPFGFDLPFELYEKAARQTEIQKACFLGNPDAHRGAFLEQLAACDVAIDVYGNDWGKFVHHRNIKVFEPVYGDEFWLTLRKYRVQLNLMRPHNPDTHNMRSFEVPGIGGIQLAPATDDHRLYFEPGKEIFLFNGPADCAEQVKKIIALTSVSAGMVRQAARERCIHSGYQYRDRALQVLGIIQQRLG